MHIKNRYKFKSIKIMKKEEHRKKRIKIIKKKKSIKKIEFHTHTHIYCYIIYVYCAVPLKRKEGIKIEEVSLPS